MSNMELPIPLADLESVLAWVDTFKLSRPTKKINRDFSDAGNSSNQYLATVLLAEMLSVHYPKLVEMHNYPPRNSHALKLNNWMTLNRKVLKKLKLNLCCNTMEQLANCAPGVIERVLVMVRDKINRDEEANKSSKDADQNLSSGGSYYEACGDEEHVLVVPVKTRVNGVLETVQQKVVNYESYLTLKEELKDAKDASEVLKQKVEHLDNMLKLKEERIDELQKQLERKQTRRREVEALQTSLAVPFDAVPPSPVINTSEFVLIPPVKVPSLKTVEPITKIAKLEESKIPIPIVDSKTASKSSIVEVMDEGKSIVERIKSEVFKEIEIIEQKSECYMEIEEFKDSEQEDVTTIEETIQNEIKNITNAAGFVQDFSYVN
ncbi:sperm flagellar protein 1 isoform X1 [Manduca sexta]|uniref:sperm flagellar protein 1 isoform X1 n=1 Tax=Manduca sexta TaxID=7130 RepID=UPI00118250F2|nr:sperm flagellar protein 1 isoform X1 [Manduca sexta]